MRHNRWLIPLGLFIAAVAFFTAGIGWAVVTGVAVPDQDPTAAMQTYATFHLRIVWALMLGGVLLFGAALLSVPVLLIQRVVAGRRAE